MINISMKIVCMPSESRYSDPAQIVGADHAGFFRHDQVEMAQRQRAVVERFQRFGDGVPVSPAPANRRSRADAACRRGTARDPRLRRWVRMTCCR
jgi:hypothetical protein